MTDLTIVQKIVVWALPLLFAITLHEVAHGYVASLFGDQTARFSGRLTLNPVKHIDPVGTVLVPLMMLLVSNFIFGWAKPVPVDPRNLRNPRRDMVFVALAGPLSNLLMAFCWGLVAKVGMMSGQSGNAWLGIPLFYMGEAGVWINVILGVLNLLPLPPLDGGKVLLSALPPRMAYTVSQVEPYGFIILVVLLLTGVLFSIIRPMAWFFVSLIVNVYGF